MLKLIGWLLVIPSALVRGWAIKLLWLWFMVPATGLKPVSTAVAYGLALFVTACTLCTADLLATDSALKDDNKVVVTYPIATMILLAYTVGLGWIVKTYFL